MKTSINFYPVWEDGRKTQPPVLNTERIADDDGKLVIPNVGDVVVFYMSDEPMTRKVVSRKIWYNSGHSHVECYTEPAKTQ